MERIRFTRVGEDGIGYRCFGSPVDGHGVVHIPNLASNQDVLVEHPGFVRFASAIGDLTGFVSFDRRGTGISDGVPARIAPTLEDWADDAIAVMDAAGVERATLFAHSMGTPPALLLAAARPDRVSSLVLTEAWARFRRAADHPEGAPPDVVEAALATVAEHHAVARLDGWYGEWVAKLGRGTFGPRAAQRAWGLWLDLDVRAVVPTVHVPVLLLHSRARTVPLRQAEWLDRNLPNSRLVVHESEDHDWWFNDGVEDAIAAVTEHLTGAPPMAPSDRVLATVLFTDIVASTERAATVGDHAWAQVLDAHDDLVRHEVERHRGRIVNPTGDGVVATFDGPTRAVDCAQRILTRVRSLGLDLRCGLHTGEVAVRGDDISGIAVHLAARVLAAAGPSQVLVTRTVCDLVAGSGLTFTPAGRHQLKGVPGEWDLFTLA